MGRNAVPLVFSRGCNWALNAAWVRPHLKNVFLRRGQRLKGSFLAGPLLVSGHHGNQCTSQNHSSSTARFQVSLLRCPSQVDPTGIHNCLEQAPPFSGVESRAAGQLSGHPNSTVARGMPCGSFSMKSLAMLCFQEMVSVSLLCFEAPRNRTLCVSSCNYSTWPIVGAQTCSLGGPQGQADTGCGVKGRGLTQDQRLTNGRAGTGTQSPARWRLRAWPCVQAAKV